MRKKTYRKFSREMHEVNFSRVGISQCQFELTFCCDLRCSHCYTGCFNNQSSAKKELNTRQVFRILDALAQAGILWLCFTGGDPLVRADFSQVYTYARKKGFLITIFTNGYSFSPAMIKYLAAHPPFSIEITLNAVSDHFYDRITRTKGLLSAVKRNILSLKRSGIPLRIKTQVTRQNIDHIPRIRVFCLKERLALSLDYTLYPQLNKDRSVCDLRVPLEKMNSFNRSAGCVRNSLGWKKHPGQTRLFPCTVTSGDGIYIDPRGKVFFCPLLRKPSFSAFKPGFEKQFREALIALRKKDRLAPPAQCLHCQYRNYCANCPGKAYLETGDMRSVVSYYCHLAKK
jgi:radical SAM protein with 4Fe4S-binding SPASM domain